MKYRLFNDKYCSEIRKSRCIGAGMQGRRKDARPPERASAESLGCLLQWASWENALGS
jgi:hypothetical protein